MIASLPLIVTLAWRPFLDPLDLHSTWPWLLPPLVLAVAIVYKTVKQPTLDKLPLEILRLTLNILILMATAAVVLWGLVELT